MSSILDIYRRNQPNPAGVPFHHTITYAASLNTSIQPGSGTALIIDRVRFLVSANFDFGASNRSLQFQSSVTPSPPGTVVTVGVIGHASPITGAVWASITGTTAPTSQRSIMSFCDDTTVTLDGTGGAMTTKDWLGSRSVRPCWKLTNTEYLVVKDAGSSGTVTGTLLISLHGWFLSDSNNY
jgi:hypothetical protein